MVVGTIGTVFIAQLFKLPGEAIWAVVTTPIANWVWSLQITAIDERTIEFVVKTIFALIGAVLLTAAVGLHNIKGLWKGSTALRVNGRVNRQDATTTANRGGELETQEQLAPVNEDLRQCCCKLSAEIREFYNHQQEDFDKRLKSDFRAGFLQEPHRSRWCAEETERHEKGMVDRYSEQFGGAVSELCDDLEPCGKCTPEQRNRFENPAGAQDIRYAAQRLDAICNSTASTSQEYRRRRIEEWRSVINGFDFETERFAGTDTYSQMREHLRPEVIEMFETPRTLHVGNEARGDTTYRYTLRDEVARIEKEWGLV